MGSKKIIRTITEEDRAASARLKSKFREFVSKHNATHEKRMTQESFGADIGLSQGAITQYLNGHSALNISTLFKFCTKIGCDPAVIYPKLFENIDSSVGNNGRCGPILKECIETLNQLKGENLDNALAYLQYLLSKQETESSGSSEIESKESPEK